MSAVSYEQFGSGYWALREAGLYEDDVVDAILALGLPSEHKAEVAFCPSIIRRTRRHRRFSSSRRPADPSHILFPDSDRFAQRLLGEKGIVICEATIVVGLGAEIIVDHRSVRIAGVAPNEEYFLRHQEGRRLSVAALK